MCDKFSNKRAPSSSHQRLSRQRLPAPYLWLYYSKILFKRGLLCIRQFLLMQKTTEFAQMPGKIQCHTSSKLDAQLFESCKQVDCVTTADIGLKIIFFVRILVIKFDDLSFLNSDFMLNLTNDLIVSARECVWCVFIGLPLFSRVNEIIN